MRKILALSFPVPITQRGAVAMLSAALCMGCIPPRVVPKQTGEYNTRPHPTREQLAALMELDQPFVHDQVNEITFTTAPRAILKGGYVMARCVVPRHYDSGRIELRGNGQAMNNPLDRMETKYLFGPFGCGRSELTCVVTTYRGVEVRTVLLETGVCDGGG